MDRTSSTNWWRVSVYYEFIYNVNGLRSCTEQHLTSLAVRLPGVAILATLRPAVYVGQVLQEQNAMW
jgi:hypothetical protein